MTLRLLHAISASAVLLLLGGCQHKIVSPPASAVILETAATLRPGETGIQVSAGELGELFGPTLHAESLRVRRGMREDLEVSGEGSVGFVTTRGDSDTTHRGIYALRVGVKYHPWKHFSLIGGLGAGAHAAGGFVSPDAGAIVAFENRYLVPFFGARVLISEPLAPHTIYLEVDDNGKPRYGRPESTLGYGFSAGLRLPLGGWANPDPSVRGSLLAAIMKNELVELAPEPAEDGRGLSFIGLHVGAEISF